MRNLCLIRAFARVTSTVGPNPLIGAQDELVFLHRAADRLV